MTLSEDPLIIKVSEELAGFRKRYLERIEKEQQRLKACKINTVYQSKRAQELKINAELQERLTELSKKGDNLDRICANFASGLTISDRDQQRLDNAKEMYEIGKNLTGVRFDYSAPPDVIKGYKGMGKITPQEDSTFLYTLQYVSANDKHLLLGESCLDSLVWQAIRDIKSEARRILSPFSLRAEDAGEPMWALIRGITDKENLPRN